MKRRLTFVASTDECDDESASWSEVSIPVGKLTNGIDCQTRPPEVAFEPVGIALQDRLIGTNIEKNAIDPILE